MKKFGFYFSILTCVILLVGCNSKEESTIIGNENIGSENTLSKNVDENGWFYLTESECYDVNGKLNANPELDDNGNIINCYNKKGKEEGKWVRYYYNGPIWMESCFKNGKHDGMFIEYYENGNILSKRYHKNGEDDGKQIVYHENGQIKMESNYVEGVIKDGKQIVYYDNGQVMEVAYYKDGKPNGEYIIYYDNGQTKAKGALKDGVPNGKRIEYTKDGELLTEYTYNNGKLVE